ncbi:DUF2798 domain-containing protein [Pontibacter sp. CAU 1760]
MKRQTLPPTLKRNLLLIGLISLLLGSALEIYTFGFADDFFSRWLRSFFVFFMLIALTALAIVPGVNYVVSKLTR